MAEYMRAPLGQTVVVETVAGAGGSIGVGRVARAAPDGYTIDIGQWDTHVGNIIFPINYDLARDFAPVGMITINAQLLTARKGFPADDLKGMVTWMKANPGAATVVDQTAAAHVTGVMLRDQAGVDFRFIPYRGAGPAMTDMLSGHVDLLIAQAAAVAPHVKSGALKILANLSPQRSTVLPNVPTSAEGGLPNLIAAGWFGFFAPKGTPKEAIAKLNSAMIAALAFPEVQKRFADLGLDIAPREIQSPEGMAAFHKAETEKWWPIIRAANIKVE
ncbi:MAG: tripartite tricarboxylate transporter substrate binding protein [Betaproteobacteria bacterium]|nr:tripartite tricarboxylate transporter substrate binding protein [Betaproteobacteria bacterium]